MTLIVPDTEPAVADTETARARSSAFARALWSLVWPIAVAVLVVVVGWLAFLTAYDVSPAVGKTPAAVWDYLCTDPAAAEHRGAVFGALGRTLTDAALGYGGGLAAALVLATVFVLFSPFEQAFLPIVMLLRSVPLVAMTPVILLAFGRGAAGVAVIGGVVVFFPAMVNIMLGLRSASRQATELVLAYGGNRLTVLRRVALPSAIPALFASARISVPAALVGALVAEWLATSGGIGGAIPNAIGGFDYAQVWSDIVVLTGASLLLYTLVAVLESVVLTANGMPDRE
ncbi:ABC transporter permease subunit [Amycolatopsis rhizosphaerae]|uniref:ABC transporter permease subunit n=1 Tax=Amycolatopsis rhizosphaerae TaxID=2053003 RepID=A0A558CEA1_9PSEU|nr:ABC transporter permease subunit [Amycolatopsis rhizosphaerae]TVT47105.1 ABC transporter permease subunit [Amycolatopsis rhizosphaerae]